jgi:RNA polymerase sigma-70 factor, ECF subfamily
MIWRAAACATTPRIVEVTDVFPASWRRLDLAADVVSERGELVLGIGGHTSDRRYRTGTYLVGRGGADTIDTTMARVCIVSQRPGSGAVHPPSVDVRSTVGEDAAAPAVGALARGSATEGSMDVHSSHGSADGDVAAQETRGLTPERRLATLHDCDAKALFNYLVKLTLGDRGMAEDILQETFVRAWRHLSRHTDTDLDAFRPWLYTVGRRLVIDMLRARRSRPVEVIVDDLGGLSVAPDDTAGVVNNLAVRDALVQLSPEHRMVLVELYYHGRTPSELAEMLNIPVGTVKSRTYYAKQALRWHLDH